MNTAWAPENVKALAAFHARYNRRRERMVVEREHCLLYGTDLVCAICEAQLGEEHEETCDRAWSEGWAEEAE